MEQEGRTRTTHEIAAVGDDFDTSERPEPDEVDLPEDPQAGASESGTRVAAREAEADERAPTAPLLAADQIERFQSDWRDIQATFVDDPRHTVERADALVADLMQRLAAEFANTRSDLEAQWDRGDDVSTEDLRVALTRYRSFFDRLLSA